MTQRVSICIVLDRSGSMEDCRSDAIGAVNSYMRSVREDVEVDGSISVIIFDSQSIDKIRDRVAAINCPEITEAEYEPRSMTPLFDAVGHGAAILAKDGAADSRKILVIMTDGLENASREHTTKSISTLLKRRQEEDGWLVIYLGADHDAWAQSNALGIRQGNAAAFAKASLPNSSQALYSRSKRYAKAANVQQDLSEGFLDDERESFQE